MHCGRVCQQIKMFYVWIDVLDYKCPLHQNSKQHKQWDLHIPFSFFHFRKTYVFEFELVLECMSWVGLQCAIVFFPGHTRLLFLLLSSAPFCSHYVCDLFVTLRILLSS